MEKKEMYTLKELYDNLEVPYAKLGKMADMSEGTVTRIKDGYPARRTTLNRLLRAFSEVYGRQLTLENVTGAHIEDKRTSQRVTTPPIEEKQDKLPTQVKTAQKSIVARSDENVSCKAFFEKQSHFQETFSESSWMRWIKNGIKTRGMEEEKFDFEEREKSGNEGKYFFTPKQAEKAIEILKRHGKLKD